MRRTDWATLALGALIASACGPNASPVVLDAASTPIAPLGVTPIAWRLEPTPTPPPPPQATAGPQPLPTAAGPQAAPQPLPTAAGPQAAPQPLPTAAGPQAAPQPLPTAAAAAPPVSPGFEVGGAVPVRSNPAGPRLATVAPTASAPRLPYPTPTQEPPVACQFGSAMVSVPSRNPSTDGLIPGVVPTQYRGTPGLTTVASGEPLSGVFVELRLPKTTFVAGVVMQPEISVRNASNAVVLVSERLSVVTDRQDHAIPPAQADARSFPNLAHGPRFGGYPVPAGQTWAIPSTVVQLPFDATPPVHVHAAVTLEAAGALQPVAGSAVGVFADVPLQLTAATTAQELHLEVHADHQQLCLRATNAQGGLPASPLFVGMTASSANVYMDGGVGGGSGGTWAERWPPNFLPTNAPIAITLWVGGPSYVTAQAQATVLPGP